jgi:putative transposase
VTDQAITELAGKVGVRSVCTSVGAAQAGYHRRHRVGLIPVRAVLVHQRGRPQPRALSGAERAADITVLHSDRFVDLAPAQVWATLLDEGVYLGSQSTFYRLLRAVSGTGERRRQATHPAAVEPELVATRPDQVYSWDITTLLGPAKWTYFYLYMILDIYSRYVVGWMLATRESAVLAEKLIADTAIKQRINRDRLTLHAHRGSSMTSKPVAFLLADLGVSQPHSRPHVSNDNPFLPSAVRDTQVPARLPGPVHLDRGGSSPLPALLRLVQQRASPQRAGTTHPSGHAHAVRVQRGLVLDAAYAARPERFVRQPPRPPTIPTHSWINPPDQTETDTR